MALDREELAARCLVALMTRDEYYEAVAAHDAVKMADALLEELRPAEPVAATLAERASAGLDAPAAPPVDKIAVDRVALARVLRTAFHKGDFNYTLDAWDNGTETEKRGYLAQADAAIAFLRGGVR